VKEKIREKNTYIYYGQLSVNLYLITKKDNNNMVSYIYTINMIDSGVCRWIYLNDDGYGMDEYTTINIESLYNWIRERRQRLLGKYDVRKIFYYID
jgi:hypothetical protein